MVQRFLLLVSISGLVLLEYVSCIQVDCGRANEDPSKLTRIIGGSSSAPNQFPWIAGFFKYPASSAPATFCTGTLIAQQWILTAPICVTNAQRFAIYLAAHNLSAYEPNRMIISSNQYYIEPSGNVALIYLASPINFNDYVQPVCLPTSDNEDHLGDSVVLAGWGNYIENSNKMSPTLRTTTSSVIDPDNCIPQNGNLPENLICTDGSSGGLCRGDEGSPLTLKTSTGTYVQIGVATLAPSGCVSNQPSGFVRLGPSINWIHQMLDGDPPTSTTVRSSSGRVQICSSMLTSLIFVLIRFY